MAQMLKCYCMDLLIYPGNERYLLAVYFHVGIDVVVFNGNIKLEWDSILSELGTITFSKSYKME